MNPMRIESAVFYCNNMPTFAHENKFNISKMLFVYCLLDVLGDVLGRFPRDLGCIDAWPIIPSRLDVALRYGS